MLNRKFEALYDDLLLDMELHAKQYVPEQKKMEWCHRSCLDYWKRVKQMVADEPFRNQRDEIDFFKCVKPMFLGRLEYYALLMQFHLFCPAEDRARAAEFIDLEVTKIWRFQELHSDFIRYIDYGDVSRDGEYFLRCEYDGHDFVLNRIYDHDHTISSRMDGLLAQLNAFKWYEEFLRKKIMTRKGK